MAIKVKQAKMAAKSIAHIVNGWVAAMECLVDDFPCNENLIKNYQYTINNEFKRLLEGRPSILAENYAKTRK